MHRKPSYWAMPKLCGLHAEEFGAFTISSGSRRKLVAELLVHWRVCGHDIPELIPLVLIAQRKRKKREAERLDVASPGSCKKGESLFVKGEWGMCMYVCLGKQSVFAGFDFSVYSLNCKRTKQKSASFIIIIFSWVVARWKPQTSLTPSLILLPVLAAYFCLLQLPDLSLVYIPVILLSLSLVLQLAQREKGKYNENMEREG